MREPLDKKEGKVEGKKRGFAPRSIYRGAVKPMFRLQCQNPQCRRCYFAYATEPWVAGLCQACAVDRAEKEGK